MEEVEHAPGRPGGPFTVGADKLYRSIGIVVGTIGRVSRDRS